MFDTASLFKQHVLVIGDIAGRVYALDAGFEKLVDVYAVVDRQTVEDVGYGRDADAGTYQIAIDAKAGFERYGLHAAIALDGRDTGAEREPHALRFVIFSEGGGHLRCEKRFPNALFMHRHGHLKPALGER